MSKEVGSSNAKTGSYQIDSLILKIASIAGIETIVFITTQRDWLAILRPY
jgi:hypothetical protein